MRVRKQHFRNEHKAPVNWDSDVYVAPDETLPFEIGDIVSPCYEMSVRIDDRIHEGLPVAVLSREHTGNVNPCVDGEPQGIYIGTRRVEQGDRSFRISDHWAGGRKQLKHLFELKHIFVFGGRKIIIDPKMIKKVQFVDDCDE